MAMRSLGRRPPYDNAVEVSWSAKAIGRLKRWAGQRGVRAHDTRRLKIDVLFRNQRLHRQDLSRTRKVADPKSWRIRRTVWNISAARQITRRSSTTTEVNLIEQIILLTPAFMNSYNPPRKHLPSFFRASVSRIETPKSPKKPPSRHMTRKAQNAATNAQGPIQPD